MMNSEDEDEAAVQELSVAIGVELEEPVVERLDPVGLRDTTFLRRSALLLRLRG